MKTLRGLLTLVLPLILLAVAAWPAVAAPPTAGGTATVKLLNRLPTRLAVGQSYTVDVLVQTDQPFTTASLQNAVEFPAYLADSSDTAQSATSAILHLTLTGRRSTASLPGGVTPATLYIGVRNKGGQLNVTSFPYSVAVY